LKNFLDVKWRNELRRIKVSNAPWEVAVVTK